MLDYATSAVSVGEMNMHIVTSHEVEILCIVEKFNICIWGSCEQPGAADNWKRFHGHAPSYQIMFWFVIENTSLLNSHIFIEHIY